MEEENRSDDIYVIDCHKRIIRTKLGAYSNYTPSSMSDEEKQIMQDAAKNFNALADANKLEEASQKLEPARNVIYQEYGPIQSCVEETNR
jgi:hypothetical protein